MLLTRASDDRKSSGGSRVGHKVQGLSGPSGKLTPGLEAAAEGFDCLIGRHRNGILIITAFCRP